MYYGLILNNENKIRFLSAQYQATQLFDWYSFIFKKLNPHLEWNKIIEVKQNIVTLNKLIKLFKSFETQQGSLQIEEYDFHCHRSMYIGLHEDIDKLFCGFKKRYPKNEVDNYRVEAMLNAHDMHKENFPPLNCNLKLNAQTKPEAKKASLR